MLRQRLQLSTRSIYRYPGPQFGHCLIVICGAVFCLGMKGVSDPDLCFTRKIKGGGQNSGNLQRLVLKAHGLAQRSLDTSKLVTSKLFAYQRRAADFLLCEVAASDGNQPKDTRKTRVNDCDRSEHGMVAQLHALQSFVIQADGFQAV